ncbi:MAG TPA: hypothetical protein PL070_00380, partial [Flavobacteriales bacterium]|nr:hypothetical protein [Flavobacteriales bacterium]
MARLISLLLLAGAFHLKADAKNYIRYHQQSLVVQEYMAQGEPAKALALLDKLEKRYGLMPTETFARALCQVAVGDTAAARSSYLKSLEQRAPLGWLFGSPPPFRSQADSLWYESVVREGMAFWRSKPQYADGPNPGMPTPVTDLNTRHQGMYDHPGDRADHAERYAALIAEHDALLLRFLSGEFPVPSIAEYGVNQEFATFVIHCSTELTTKHESTFKRWLKSGLIYPVLYATPFDDRAN